MSTRLARIALPPRQILLPRFEFPAFLRHLKDDAVSQMRSPLGGAGQIGGALGVGRGAASNILASVPWVAQWKFNGDGNDSIGTNHLTAVSSPTFTTGKLGGATGATQLTSAGNESWFILSNASVQTGNIDFLIAAWVYFDIFTTAGIVGKDEGTAADDYRLDYETTSSRFRFFICNAGAVKGIVSANSFGAPSLATWCLIVAWYNSALGTVNICGNNGTIDSAACSGVPRAGTQPLRVGAFRTTTSALNGRLDNVLFAEGAGAVPSQTVLDALWNGGAGTETLT